MKCPKELTGEAAKAWKKFSAILPAEKADAAALQVLCETWAEWTEASEKVKAQGLVVKLPNGWPGPNPYLPIRQKAAIALNRLFREFGLTPAARAKIIGDGAEQPSGDDLDF